MPSNVGANPERITIPYGVSYEGLLDVIGAWYRAQGYAKPMKTGEVGQQVRSGAKPESKAKVVSNQSSFLAQIGILRRVGQSNQLTETGREVSRLVDQGLRGEFSSAMKRIILAWSQARPLLDTLRDRGGVSRQELVELIVQVSGKSMGTTNAAMGATALVALFEGVGLMRDEGGSLVMADVVTFEERPAQPRTEEFVSEPPQPTIETTPAEKHEETVVSVPSEPIVETTPTETHEETVVTQPPQPTIDTIPAWIRERAEAVASKQPQPAEETAPTETHEEAVVSEPPQATVETALVEKREETLTLVSVPPQQTEDTAPTEKHEETETDTTEPSQSTEEESETEKHDDTETP